MKVTGNRRHILYISYDGMTDPLGQSQVLPYLMGLGSYDYNFHLVSFEKPERYKSHAREIKRSLKGTNIHWYPLKYRKTPPIISTIADMNEMRRVCSNIIRNNSIEIIHARSYIAGKVAMNLSSTHKLPFVFDMRGFWADERIDGGIWNVKNPVFRLVYSYFKRLEKKLLIISDSVVSLTHNAKTEILKWDLGIPEEKITVIPCCVDTELFKPNSGQRLSAQVTRIKTLLKNAKAGPVLVYLGAIGTWYLLDEMLSLFSEVLNKMNRAHLLVITTESPDTVTRTAKKYKLPLDHITITESSRNEVPLLIELADIGIFFIKPLYSKKASSPTKQGELMSMGLPVICNTGVGDTDHIINNYKCGYIIKDFSSSSFIECVDKWEQIRNIDPEEVRKGAIEYYSLNNGIDSYHKIYKKL